MIGMALMLFGGCQEDDALVSMDEMTLQTRDIDYTAKGVGNQITLGFGESVLIEPEGFTILFRDVMEDSRYPRDLDCIWEGRAVIQFEFERVDDCIVATLESPNSRSEDGNILNMFGKSVKLLKVAPYPQNSNTIPLRQYKVVIQVARPILDAGDNA